MDATTVTEWAESWKAESVYSLANEAECGGPDETESAGGRFLDHVRDSVIEAVEYQDAAGLTEDGLYDQLAGVADGAPDVYTSTRWAEFVDLAAYQEDADLSGEWPKDLTEAAGWALYQIAERLAHKMVADLFERAEDAEVDA